MKTVNTPQVQNVPNGAKWSPMTTLYNIKTGKPERFHNIDAKEKLKVHPDRWSTGPVSMEQSKAEDAVIVEDKPKKLVEPMIEQAQVEVQESVKPAIETMRQRKARLRAEELAAKAEADKSDDK